MKRDETSDGIDQDRLYLYDGERGDPRELNRVKVVPLGHVTPGLAWQEGLVSSSGRFIAMAEADTESVRWRLFVRDESRKETYEIAGLIWPEVEPSNLVWSEDSLVFDQVGSDNAGRAYCVNVESGEIVYVLPFVTVIQRTMEQSGDSGESFAL